MAAGPKNLVKQIKQPNLVKAVEMAQKGKDKSLKNLIKSRVPDVKNKKLFSKIPGITDLFEMAKSIPDDFKKAKYLSTGLKTLGVAAAPLVAYDLYSAFKEGKPLLEVLEQGFVGTDVIGGTKRLISLSPKGKEARAVVKKAEMDDQIAQDDTFLDTDLGMLPVESDLTLEEAEKKYKEEAQKISEQEALQNKQRGENRFNLFTTEEPKPIELNKGGLVAQYFGIVPNRGRVGLKLGTPKKLYDLGKKIIKNKEPENPDRRDFLKGAGALGLAITAFGTGALKLAKTLKTKTALETLAKPAAGQPEWFAPLVDKIITKGIYTKNLDKVDTYTFKEGDQTLKLIKEEPETFSNGYTYGGKIRIEVEAGGAFDQPFSMTYFPNDKYIRKGQEVPRPGFQVIESRPGYTAVGPGDFDLEDIEYVHSTSGKDTSLLELPKGGTGILSDMEGLEKIATGKIKNPKLQKKRQEINEKLMRNPTEDRAIEYYDD